MIHRIIVIMVVIIVSAKSDVMRRNYNINRRIQCDELRCEHATIIADRLSKLSLLPEFVTQTLFLLEDLMKEMEIELQKSATFLMDKVEPTCDSTVEIIQSILKKTNKRSGRQRNSELGMGIEPLHTSEIQDDHSTKDNYNNENRQEIKFDHSNNPTDESYWPAVDRKEHEWNPLNSNPQRPNPYDRPQKWRPITEKVPQWSSESSDTWDKELKYNSWDQPNNNKNHYPSAHGEYSESKDSEQTAWNPYDSSVGKTTDPKPVGQSEKKYDTKRKSKGKKSSNVGKGIERFSSSVKEPPCRGIDKQSPFWVPGIDQWCQTNCDAGYCPETHCIC